MRPARRNHSAAALHPILRKMDGPDLRSIGRSNEVVAEVFADPKRFRTLFAGLRSQSKVLRARAADAIEKITAKHPEYLARYKAQLIGPLARVEQKEVRWHVAQMLPRIRWTERERERVVVLLTGYLNDPSSLVKTFAMQALADLARQSPRLRPRVLRHLHELTAIGTPAMKARGRKLLAVLDNDPAQSRRRPSAQRAATRVIESSRRK